MRLKASIQGNLHQFIECQKSAAETAVTAGVQEITDRIKNDLRTQVTAAGLGSKLAKSWQSKLYPKGKKSIAAAGWVFSKAPKLIRAFDEGALIRGKNVSFLAIPTDAAPKRGVGGKRISPSNFPEHALGKLRFVPRKGAPSLLVVDSLQAGKGGRFRKASKVALKTGRGLTTVVMFILVPQVNLKKRLNYKSVAHRWESHLPQAILNHWPEGCSVP